MANPQKTHRGGPTGDGEWDRRVTKMTLSLYPADVELLAWIERTIGCSQSEAYRTAIRVAAAALASIPNIGASQPSTDKIK